MHSSALAITSLLMEQVFQCVAHCRNNFGTSPPSSQKKRKNTSSSSAPSAKSDITPCSKWQQLNQFASANLLQVVGADPGKRNLLYLTNQHAPDNKKKKEGIRLRYTF